MKKYLLPKEGNFYKANLHCHTTISDGRMTVEETKRDIIYILKKIVDDKRNQYEYLNDALWAYRLGFKTSLGFSPYQLVYGKSCILPVSTLRHAYRAFKRLDLDLWGALNERLLQLEFLNENRLDALERQCCAKKYNKASHDSKISKKQFQTNDEVLRFTLRLHKCPAKPESKWDGPFRVLKVNENGSIMIEKNNGANPITVNGHRLKLYLHHTSSASSVHMLSARHEEVKSISPLNDSSHSHLTPEKGGGFLIV